MTASLLRKTAVRVGRIAAWLMPTRHGCWAEAMLRELVEIRDDWEALRFALGCLRTSIIQSLLSRPPTGTGAADRETSEGNVMTRFKNDPRAVGVACAAAATGLGISYLAVAGAPQAFILMNGAALAIGLILLTAIGRTAPSARIPGGLITLLLGAALVATTLIGSSAEGATRWIHYGTVAVQPSLVLLPLLVVGFARQQGGLGATGVAMAALALALQPDRAMAGVLAAAIVILLLMKPGRLVFGACAAATLSFIATLLSPDTLPATPYVDQILFTAFDVHPLAGLAVVIGAALLLVPAGFLLSRGEREACAAFGATWLAIILAAALGNYPTPVVGYGGSAILGYLLSLAALPPAARQARHGPAGTATSPAASDVKARVVLA